MHSRFQISKITCTYELDNTFDSSARRYISKYSYRDKFTKPV